MTQTVESDANEGGPNPLFLKRYTDLVSKVFDPNSPIYFENLLDLVSAIILGASSQYIRNDKYYSLFMQKMTPILSDLLYRASSKDFSIIKKLGQGGFGAVYLAQNKQNKQYYAMKKVDKKSEFSDPTVDSHSIEKAIMLASRSPWIPQLLCCYQDTHALFYVMDLMSGGDLEGLLEATFPNLPENLIRYYGASALMGINALHELGFIHRDIKPANYLLNSNGQMKIADFGTCIQLDSDKKWVTIAHAGTPDYMSPEIFSSIATGKTRPFGLETDYWSYGCLLYYIRADYEVFGQDENVDVQKEIMNFKPGSMDWMEDDDEFNFNEDEKDLINNLICFEDKRFDFEKVKNHPYFKDIDWNNLHKENGYVQPLSDSFYKPVLEDINQFNQITRPVGVVDAFQPYDLPFTGFSGMPKDVLDEAIKANFTGGTNSTPGSAEQNAEQANLINELTEKLGAMDAELNEQVKKQLLIQQDYDKMKVDLIDLEAKSQVANNLAKDFEATVNKQNDKISTLNKEKAELNEKINTLQAEDAALKENQANLMITLEASKKAAAKSKSRVEEIEALMNDLKKEKCRLEWELQESSKTAAAQNNPVDTNTTELEETIKTLNAKKSQIEYELNQANQSIVELKSKLKKSEEENTELSSQISKNEQELSINKNKLDLLNTKSASLNADYQLAIENNEDLEKELESFKKKINRQEVDINTYVIKLQELEKQKEAHNKERAKYIKLDKKITVIEKEKTTLIGEISASKENIEQLNSELKVYQTQKELFDQEKAQSEQMIQKLKKSNKIHEEQAKQFMKLISMIQPNSKPTIKMSSSNKDSVLVKHKHEIAEKNKLIEIRDKKIQDLNVENDKLRSEKTLIATNSQKQLEELREQLNISQAKLKALDPSADISPSSANTSLTGSQSTLANTTSTIDDIKIDPIPIKNELTRLLVTFSYKSDFELPNIFSIPTYLSPKQTVYQPKKCLPYFLTIDYMGNKFILHDATRKNSISTQLFDVVAMDWDKQKNKQVLAKTMRVWYGHHPKSKVVVVQDGVVQKNSNSHNFVHHSIDKPSSICVVCNKFMLSGQRNIMAYQCKNCNACFHLEHGSPQEINESFSKCSKQSSFKYLLFDSYKEKELCQKLLDFIKNHCSREIQKLKEKEKKQTL